jgi:hypothetical protein
LSSVTRHCFMTLYAYCLGDEVSGGMLEDVAGVGGARPRLLTCGDIALVVSDYQGERVAVEREQVFAHERVIRRVLRQATPLPFRFGTLAAAAELEAYVETRRDALMKSLERVRGSVEMSVKIIWDAEQLKRESLRADEREDRQGARPSLGEGASYLEARRREILGDQLLKERAEELAAWLTERVAGEAVEQEVEARPGESLVVRAAFLVRRERLDEYQAGVEKARAERPGLRFLTSGPWPPYSFSTINP